MFKAQSILCILYRLSQCKFTCAHHCIVAAEELSPTAGLVTKKVEKQQTETLKNQLEEVAREAKDLWDCFSSNTEETANNML